MGYLFDQGIEAALKSDALRGNAMYLKDLCETKTKSLIESHGREWNIHDDLATAHDLVMSMGNQFKPKDGPWAGDYVSEWRMVSGNAGLIRGMVDREVDKAYQIGLDVRSHKVLGTMFNLAVQIWSMIGEYSSPSQAEGRR